MAKKPNTNQLTATHWLGSEAQGRVRFVLEEKMKAKEHLAKVSKAKRAKTANEIKMRIAAAKAAGLVIVAHA